MRRSRAAAASATRARPDLRRRLRRPVISVGNLAVGGRGKTPLVASIVRELLAMGERPAILSRGYARRSPEDGVVVVATRDGIRADLDRAGDEPLMLARRSPASRCWCRPIAISPAASPSTSSAPRSTCWTTGSSTCSSSATSTS